MNFSNFLKQRLQFSFWHTLLYVASAALPPLACFNFGKNFQPFLCFSPTTERLSSSGSESQHQFPRENLNRFSSVSLCKSQQPEIRIHKNSNRYIDVRIGGNLVSEAKHDASSLPVCSGSCSGQQAPLQVSLMLHSIQSTLTKSPSFASKVFQLCSGVDNSQTDKSKREKSE